MTDEKNTKEDRPVVAHIMFPVRQIMRADENHGYMPMLIADCVAEISDDSGEKVGEVGGAMGATLHLRVGRNTFYVKVADLWNGLVDMVTEHPELAPGVDVSELGKFDSE